jgi:hypothetical protein
MRGCRGATACLALATLAIASSETKLAEGDEVELAFDPADLHLFDPATGSRLTYEPEPQPA